MLTEHEISRTWRILFKENPLNEETFTRAEALLDELRGESPLRHRLATELDELREKAKPQAEPKPTVRKTRARKQVTQ